MKSFNAVLILALLLIQMGSIIAQEQLLFVVETFRHGARYPFGDSGFWNAESQAANAGQLSATGIRQHYAFGQTIRQQYIDDLQFLSPNFNHSEMYVRSTQVNRTIMSALAHLQGLYPIGTGPSLPLGLPNIYTVPPFVNAVPLVSLGSQALPYRIQTDPVHMYPYSQDPLLNAYDCCPNLQQTINVYKNTTTYQDQVSQINKFYNQTYQQFEQMINTTTPINFNNIDDLYDVLTSDMYNGEPLPPGYTYALWETLYNIDSLYWGANYGYSDNVTIIQNNFILQEISQYFQNASLNQTNGKKWIIYSSHDVNIASLQYVFNLTSFNCLYENLIINNGSATPTCMLRPNFASSFIFELWNITDAKTQTFDYYVKIKYNGDYVNVCGTNSNQCQLSVWQNAISKFTLPTLAQYWQLCGNGTQIEGADSLLAASTEFYQASVTEQEPIQAEDQPDNFEFNIIIAGEILGILLLTFTLFAMRKSDQK